MKILALDFSSSQRSVAVVQSTCRPGPVFESEIIEAGSSATRAFAMIERALSEARLEREEINCLAVGLGPGSYTGIRVAISIAQGWQFALGVKLLGLSTVECLAAQARHDGLRGEVNIVIDAQRGEFYLSKWELTEQSRTEVEPLRLATRDDMDARLSAGEPVLGPGLKRWFPDASELYPSARVLGELASEQTGFVKGNQLKPIYLRQTSFVKAPPPRRL